MKLSIKDRAEVARRANRGESHETLAAEFEISTRYVRMLARKRMASNLTVLPTPECQNVPQTELETGRRAIEILSVELDRLGADLEAVKEVTQNALECGSTSDLRNATIARGILIDKVAMCSEKLVILHKQHTPKPVPKPDFTRRVKVETPR